MAKSKSGLSKGSVVALGTGEERVRASGTLRRRSPLLAQAGELGTATLSMTSSLREIGPIEGSSDGGASGIRCMRGAAIPRSPCDDSISLAVTKYRTEPPHRPISQRPLLIDGPGHKPNRQPALPRHRPHATPPDRLNDFGTFPLGMLARLPVDHLRVRIVAQKESFLPAVRLLADVHDALGHDVPLLRHAPVYVGRKVTRGEPAVGLLVPGDPFSGGLRAKSYSGHWPWSPKAMPPSQKQQLVVYLRELSKCMSRERDIVAGMKGMAINPMGKPGENSRSALEAQWTTNAQRWDDLAVAYASLDASVCARRCNDLLVRFLNTCSLTSMTIADSETDSAISQTMAHADGLRAFKLDRQGRSESMLWWFELRVTSNKLGVRVPFSNPAT